MNDRQENKLSMYFTTQDVVNENNSVWSGLPAYVRAFNSFETVVDNISSTAIQQGANITGLSKKKRKQRDAMAKVAYEVNKAGLAYGSSIDDDDVRATFGWSRSDLKSVRDSDSLHRCQGIYDDASDIGAGVLTDFGVDNPKLAELQAAINAFSNINTKPRAAIGARKTATADLIKLFDAGDVLLKEQLDGLMEKFSESDPGFYSEYFNARIIVDLGSRKTFVEGAVLDAATEEAINKATVKLVLKPGEPEEEIRETVTDETGAYQFESMVAGEHELRVQKSGYKDVVLPIVVEAGKVNVVDVAMESLP